jgi:hypothetical protein
MSTKSRPGDGTHGKGTKGGKTDGGSAGLVSFMRQMWHGLTHLGRS